ncbi:MAG: metallophosphoesterase [Eubacteriales bacterium]|nr:metallophosphoesterase [Eubacteriales bacterium]
MTPILFMCWFILTALIFASVCLIEKKIIKKDAPPVLFLCSALRVIAASGIAYLLMAVNHYLSWNAGYPLGALYIVLMAMAGADLIRGIFVMVSGRRPAKKTVLAIKCAAAAAIFLWGTVNMQIISPLEHVYTSPKIDQPHTFVFISDIHYGSSQDPAIVRKALEEVEELRPEFIVLGGDITDEFTTMEEMLEIYRMFGEMDIPVYYVYGNHDRQPNADMIGGASYSPQELEQAITGCGIRILKDEWVYAAPGVVLVGREDISVEGRIGLTALPERPEDAYIIWVDHSPYQDDEIAS